MRSNTDNRSTALMLTTVFVQAATDKSIQWVPRVRWVVDGNIWSSSGVSAGASYYPTSFEGFIETAV